MRLATFNIRNVTDRYDARRALLGAAFCELEADIVGLQEVGFREGKRQDDFLASCARERGRVYLSLESRSERFPDFGTAILFAAGTVAVHEEIPIGLGRTAQRALFELPNQRTLWFVNTHLHHKPEEPAERDEQVRRILTWMESAPEADAMAIAGDFNAPPVEAAYARMVAAGFRSACFEADGHEPAVTWPSGIQAPTMDTEGEPNCLDYIWVRGAIDVISASVAADGHAPGDPTLYPSDHFAIIADVAL